MTTDACTICGQTTYEPAVLPAHGETHDRTITVLRQYRDGTILALFPGDAEGAGLRFPSVPCFAHVGQHSRADYYLVVSHTTPADPRSPEAQALLDELRSLGYSPLIRRRFTPTY